jgi:hypothetical protein
MRSVEFEDRFYFRYTRYMDYKMLLLIAAIIIGTLIFVYRELSGFREEMRSKINDMRDTVDDCYTNLSKEFKHEFENSVQVNRSTNLDFLQQFRKMNLIENQLAMRPPTNVIGGFSELDSDNELVHLSVTRGRVQTPHPVNSTRPVTPACSQAFSGLSKPTENPKSETTISQNAPRSNSPYLSSDPKQNEPNETNETNELNEPKQDQPTDPKPEPVQEQEVEPEHEPEPEAEADDLRTDAFSGGPQGSGMVDTLTSSTLGPITKYNLTGLKMIAVKLNIPTSTKIGAKTKNLTRPELYSKIKETLK